MHLHTHIYMSMFTMNVYVYIYIYIYTYIDMYIYIYRYTCVYIFIAYRFLSTYYPVVVVGISQHVPGFCPHLQEEFPIFCTQYIANYSLTNQAPNDNDRNRNAFQIMTMSSTVERHGAVRASAGDARQLAVARLSRNQRKSPRKKGCKAGTLVTFWRNRLPIK